MAVIENDIQYNWVQRRVLKLKEKVDENTPLDNRYRIELELLSKIEKEYSEEHPIIQEKVEEIITTNIKRTTIKIYEGLPIMLKAVKGTALCEEIGKNSQWMSGRLNRSKNGLYSIRQFTESDVHLVNKAVWSLGKKLSEVSIEYSTNRQVVIDQIKLKLSAVFLNYIAVKEMEWSEKKFKTCMVNTKAKGKYASFTEYDVQQIICAVHKLAVKMLSIEFIP